MKRPSIYDKCLALFMLIMFSWGGYKIYYYIGGPLPGRIGQFRLWPLYLMLIFIVFFIIIKQIENKPFSHYGFRKPKQWNRLVHYLFLLMPLALAARLIDPQYDFDYALDYSLFAITGVLLFNASMPFFVIKEELVFRGILQNKLRAYGLYMAISISMAFALMHAQIPVDVHVVSQVVSVFIGSFVLIAFFEITKNLWLAILLHLIYNVVIVFQIWLHVSHGMLEWVFWAVMMIGFFASIRPLLKDWNMLKWKFPRLLPADIVFLIIFSLILPIALVIFTHL